MFCKPKELWKTLKSIVLPNDTSFCSTNGIVVNKLVQYGIEYFGKGLKILFKSGEKSFKKTCEISEWVCNGFLISEIDSRKVKKFKVFV